MTENKMLIIDQELVGRMDENRGNLSRVEFVELCVNTCFEEAKLEPETPLRKAREETYFTGEESRKFRRSPKDFIAVDRELMERIDENRGNLNRAEFVKLCVNTCFEEAELEPETPLRKAREETYASKEDLEPPRSYHRPKSERYDSEEYYDLPRVLRGMVKGLKRRLREAIGSEESEPALRRSSRSKSSYPEAYGNSLPAESDQQNMYFSLWIPAILLFGFGDTLLSTMVFAKGGHEANPLMGSLVSMFGGSLFAFVLIKTVIMVALAYISFKMFKRYGWLIPTALCFVGTYLVFSNLIAYLKL